MIPSRIWAGVAMVCALLCAPAHAQTGSAKTPTALATEANAFFADNMVGGITPFNTRQTLLDIIASYAAITNIPVFGPGSSTVGHFATWGNTGGSLLVDTAPISANPVLYGADPTGVADSSAAFTSACAASPFVLFPPGVYLMNSKVTCTINAGTAFGNHLTVQGSGSGSTRLNFANATDGLEIDYLTLSSGASVRNITIQTTQLGAGIGLTLKLPTLNTNAAASSPSDIYDVVLRGNASPIGTQGWGTNLNLQNVSNVTVQDLFAFGYAVGGSHGIGIEFIGNTGLASSAVSLSVNSSFLISLAVGIQYDALTQGLFVTNSNLTNNLKGIFVPSGLAQLTQLTAANLQINPSAAAGATGVELQSGVSAFSVNNSFFIIPNTTTGILVNHAAVGGYVIGNNIIAGAGGGTGVNFQTIAANIGGVVSGNSFSNLTTAWTIGATSDFIAASGNTFQTSGTNISNSSTGTHNQIIANPGFNPVGVTAAATVGASPATITAGPSPETHYVKQSANFNAAITKSGNALCTTPSAAVPCVVELGPNEAMVVTWTTTAPTDTKDVH